MNTRAVSFRAQLKGTVSDFLKREGMSCPHTEEALLELIVALSHYTEEGLLLFPQVVLCDELDTTLRLLQGSDPLGIGSGPRGEATIKEALKRCATLARPGWVVFVQRLANDLFYGVFRSPWSPTALEIRDTVRALANDAERPHIIVVNQLADKAVELMGASSGAVYVYLSATPDDAQPPHTAVEALCRSCCADIGADEKEQVLSYVRRTYSLAIQQSHGTLIAVEACDEPAPVRGDALMLANKIELSNLVRAHELQRTDETLAALTAYSNLVAGMVATDGIVILDSKAAVLGYNMFITQEVERTESPRIAGGARRRAYKALCKWVDSQKLRACFIRSSDGASEYYGREE
ncbi:MAG TPA: hypothetical protein VFV34_20490 [Blastocatellia bacterium]|nr:hypothetical protein [Blastocatellia bacterium]